MAVKVYVKKADVEKLTRKLNKLLSLPPINKDNYKDEYNYRYQVAARNSKIKQLQRELAQIEEKAEK
ncbi:MAG: hypothetical protein FD167_309 [bacterium]|nr:MAG: hypothetical protein FD167_309 [bacterium]